MKMYRAIHFKKSHFTSGLSLSGLYKVCHVGVWESVSASPADLQT